ncbi:MAG: hypothetical protein R3Y11_12790 [Pseudomonadota bacterium]
MRKDLVTNGNLQDTKHELLKWMMGMFLVQTAMLIAVIAFSK